MSRPVAQQIQVPANNKNKLGKNQVEVKVTSVGGKEFRKDGMVFRWSKEDGRFEFVFEEDGVKTRFEGKRESLAGKRIKPNFNQGTCAFQVKQAIYRKEDPKQTSLKGTSVWINGRQVNEQTVVILLKDKEQLKPMLENPFFE